MKMYSLTAAATTIVDPESVINDILTRGVAEGMMYAKRTRRKRTKELEEMKKKIQEHENMRRPYNDRLRQLNQRRKKLEEERTSGTSSRGLQNTIHAQQSTPHTSLLTQFSLQKPI